MCPGALFDMPVHLWSCVASDVVALLLYTCCCCQCWICVCYKCGCYRPRGASSTPSVWRCLCPRSAKSAPMLSPMNSGDLYAGPIRAAVLEE